MYTIQLHKCTPKQCVVLWGLRESIKYALYNVRFIYPVFGIKNVVFYCMFVFIYLGGGGVVVKTFGGGGG